MTRPDYCPIAQEPCQAMCVLTGVRCQIQPVKPATTEDLKVYQSIADNYKKGTIMNQNDQMRELEPCPFCGSAPEFPEGIGTQYEIECNDCCQSIVGIQICDLMTLEERSTETFENYRYSPQYVERAKQEAVKRWNTRAHVNETSKNEHDNDDVLSRAPLVRLKEKQIIKAWNEAHKKSGNHRSYQFDLDFAQAIMDAMEKINQGETK